MYDRLEDTPLYKEIIRLASEKAHQEGFQEGLREELQEGELKVWREMLLIIVLTRFPKLFRLTKLVSSTINEKRVLRTLIVSFSKASTSKKARRFLLAII